MIKKADNVRVISGENKGKEGKVIAILKNKTYVVLEGINMVKKHIKPNGQNEPGGIREVEAPIHISNVKKVEKTKKEVKVKESKKEVKETKKVATKKKVVKKDKE